MGGKGPRRRLGPEERRLWERVAAGARPLRHAGSPEGRLNDQSASEGRKPVAGQRPPDLQPRLAEPLPPDRAATGAPEVPRLRPALRLLPGGARDGTSLGLSLPEAGPVGRPQAGLDRRTAERLRKGARAPDARIDLHGMTAERAHRACLRFLGDAIARGHRVVLVITGKGGRGDADAGPAWSRGRGVLRGALPGWLRASPLGGSIVGIYEAHRRHGGEGAFYVYIKRHR